MGLVAEQLTAQERQQQLQRKILEAQWFGGQVRYGTDPQHVTPVFPGMRKIATEIPCRWVDTPQDGYPATLECEIDGQFDTLVVEPTILQVERSDKRPASAYKAYAEQWMLWKWHTARGTPTNPESREFKTAYFTEPGFVPPKFVWEEVTAQVEAPAPRKRRGRPASKAKTEEAAA